MPSNERAMNMSLTIKTYVLLSLILLHLLYAFFLNPTGLLSIDEGTYHLMTKSFSEHGSLELWNGYREFPSPELTLWNTRVHDGRLMPQYPYLFPVLAAPFYLLFGFKGLFLLNAFSFVGILGFSYAIAKRLFNDTNLALNSCLILLLATYFWEYSQGAWSHAVAVLFTTAAFYFALSSCKESKEGKGITLALTSGLIAGFGAGIRLDAIFIVPVLLVPFLLDGQWRAKKFAAIFIGLFPGLGLLSFTNSLKFGTFSPFSYGVSDGSSSTNLEAYWPIITAGLLILMGSALLKRIPPGFLTGKRKIILGVLIATILFALIPSVRHATIRWSNGFYQLVVDLRARDLNISEGALSRTNGRGVVYYGLALKKALLQSCPYLTILLWPLIRLKKDRKATGHLICLYVSPIVFVAIFSYFAWHGGPGFNMRYFLPILPFTSILSAYAWKDLTSALNTTLWLPRWTVAGLLLGLTYIAVQFIPESTWAMEEFSFLTLPLLLALPLLAFSLFSIFANGFIDAQCRGATSVVMILTLTWGWLSAFAYDFTRGHLVRSTFASITQETAKTITFDSIIFVDYPEAFFGLEKEQTRIAIPAFDDFKDFRPLIDFHLDAGHSAYLSFDAENLQDLQSKGLLRGLTVTPILTHQFGTLAQIIRSSNNRDREVFGHRQSLPKISTHPQNPQ